MWKLKSWFVSEWRLSLEFSCLQQILNYPATEYNRSLCKEGCLRPLCLIPWSKINFICCVQGNKILILPQKEPKMQMCSLVTLTLLILPEVQVHPLVFLCFVLVSSGPTSCFTEHLHCALPCSLLCAPFMALAKGCYGMRSLCALIIGKIQASLDFYATSTWSPNRAFGAPKYQHWIRAEVWMGINTLFSAYRKIRHYVSISRLCNDNNKVSENSAMLTLVWA